MAQQRRSLRRDNLGFSGLEAAIVLTACVVAAAAFSFVIMNASFFATQKAKTGIHIGVAEATSSMELVGDVLAKGRGSTVRYVIITVVLTAGQPNPVGLTRGRTVITYTDNAHYDNNVRWTIRWIETNDGNSMLDYGEKAEITVRTTGYGLTANKDFSLAVKPPQGATLVISRTIPACVDRVMNLH